MRKCDSCGKPYSDSKDVFCPHCGAVGSKKCTHKSIYDSSRYDRGEIYESSAKTKYSPGAEPHAQRNYGEPEINKDIKSIGRQIGEALPKINTPATFSGDSFKKAKSIIGVIVLIIALFTGLGEGLLPFWDDADYGSYEEIVDESIYAFGFVEQAEVIPLSYGGGELSFEIKIGDAYFNDSEGSVAQQAEYLSEGFCGEIEAAVFNIEDIDYSDLQYVSDNAWYISSEDFTQAGRFGFEPFGYECGEIVYITSFSIPGSDIVILLPFDAFSCDENGIVTYFKNAGDDLINLVECMPEGKINESDISLVLSFEDFGITVDSYVEVTVDASVGSEEFYEGNIVTEVTSDNAQ